WNNITNSGSGIAIGVNASTACAANDNNEVESNIVGNNGVGVEIVVRSGCAASQTGNQISHNTLFFNSTAITDQGVGTVESGNRIVP
ncbi:MAG TPA: hypothetical protein VHM88_19585, partial [Candidatus Acidoferrales bacterium]|nr:hypothetical protein [Candidatus Acidoferrales bacterium]